MAQPALPTIPWQVLRDEVLRSAPPPRHEMIEHFLNVTQDLAPDLSPPELVRELLAVMFMIGEPSPSWALRKQEPLN